MGKAQLAMWTLTKMAMLFFIIALCLIIMSFAGREKQALCINRAQAVATGLGSAIAQVVNSPLEDERIVYPLEAVLTVGKADYERYLINITIHDDDPQNPFFVIDVATTSPGCSSGTRVGYPPALTIAFIPPEIDIPVGAETFKGRTLTPSKPDPPLEPETQRSRYVTIVRCQSKKWTPGGPTRKLFIQDCKHANPAECLNFYDDPSGAKEACEWT